MLGLFYIITALVKMFWIPMAIIGIVIIVVAVKASREEKAYKEEQEILNIQKNKIVEQKRAEEDKIAAHKLSYKQNWNPDVLSSGWIKNQCEIMDTYTRGCTLYNVNFVQDIYIYGSKAHGRVKSSKATSTYFCEVEFDSLGNLISQHCECPAFRKYRGACKHLVAFYKGMTNPRLIRVVDENVALEEYKSIDLTKTIDEYFTKGILVDGYVSIEGRISNIYKDYFTLRETKATTLHAFETRCFVFSDNLLELAAKYRNSGICIYGKIKNISTISKVVLSIDVYKIDVKDAPNSVTELISDDSTHGNTLDKSIFNKPVCFDFSKFDYLHDEGLQQAYIDELKIARDRIYKAHNLVYSNSVYTVGIKNGKLLITDNEYIKRDDILDWKDIVKVASYHKCLVGLKSDGTLCVCGQDASNYSYLTREHNIIDFTNDMSGLILLDDHNKVHHVGGEIFRSLDGWNDVVAFAEGGCAGLTRDGIVRYNGVLFASKDAATDWFYHQDEGRVVSVCNAHNNILGIRADGKVIVAGTKYFYQDIIRDWTGIISLSAGYEHVLGLKDDGTVVACGENYYGECNVSSWIDIVSVKAGINYSIGLKSDGTLVSCGINDKGQRNIQDWKLFDSLELVCN